MNEITASASVRDLMLAFKHYLMQQFPEAGLKDIQPHILRAGAPLLSTAPPVIELSHTFNTYKNTNNGQILIHENDGFAAVAARIVLQKITISSSRYANEPLYSYVNQTVFAGANEIVSLEGLLTHGLVNIVVENDPVISDLSVSFFNHVPELLATATTPASTSAYNNFEQFKPLFRSMAFSGKQKNQIRFEIPGTTTDISSPAGTHQNVVYMEMIGYKLVGIGDNVQSRGRAQGVCLS